MISSSGSSARAQGAPRTCRSCTGFAASGHRWPELLHLAGHRGSGPVRIGNGAVKQMQTDAYGQILEAAYLYARAGGEPHRE